jgi:hypothetical protein
LSTMISMLHSPTKTFEYIRERGGSFAIPFITLIVIALVAMILQIPMLERAIDAQEIDLGDSGVTQETVKQFAVYGAVIMGPVLVVLSTFFLGLVLLLLNLIVRGEATYMQLAKVSLFSLIPNMISSIIIGIMSRNSDMESANDALFSMGALFEEREGFIFGLANIIDPFSLWSLAIIIIGASVMCRRPMRTVGIWISGVWLVIQLIFALLA